jgi:hypothetical protein
LRRERARRKRSARGLTEGRASGDPPPPQPFSPHRRDRTAPQGQWLSCLDNMQISQLITSDHAELEPLLESAASSDGDYDFEFDDDDADDEDDDDDEDEDDDEDDVDDDEDEDRELFEDEEEDE